MWPLGLLWFWQEFGWPFITWEGWISNAMALFWIRVVADYGKKRIYYKTGALKIHLHHFLLAMPTFVIVVIAYERHFDVVAALMAGFAFALIESESKELILQDWQP